MPAPTSACAAAFRRCGRAESEISEPDLAAQIEERDRRDSTRADAPLAQAPDAVYLDSSGLGIEEVEQAILKIVRARMSNGKEFS